MSETDLVHVLPPSAAVLADLAGMPADIQRSTEAATALALAQELERGRAQSSAAVAKELVLLMQELRGRSEAREDQEDPLDKLAKLRLVRLSGDSAS